MAIRQTIIKGLSKVWLARVAEGSVETTFAEPGVVLVHRGVFGPCRRSLSRWSGERLVRL